MYCISTTGTRQARQAHHPMPCTQSNTTRPQAAYDVAACDNTCTCTQVSFSCYIMARYTPRLTSPVTSTMPAHRWASEDGGLAYICKARYPLVPTQTPAPSHRHVAQSSCGCFCFFDDDDDDGACCSISTVGFTCCPCSWQSHLWLLLPFSVH